MIPNGTKRVTLHLFIGKIIISGYSLPFEAFAGYVFLGGEGLFGSPSGWGLDTVGIGYDTIVVGAESVHDRWVLFVD